MTAAKSKPAPKKPAAKKTKPVAKLAIENITPLAVPAPQAKRAPVIVDGRNRRSDDDALQGGFAKVVSGPHAGKHGTFDEVVTHGYDGYPETVVLRTRDGNVPLIVHYPDLRPDTSGRR